jgi:hypothetical protein
VSKQNIYRCLIVKMFGIFLALTLGLMLMGYAYAAVQSHPASQIDPGIFAPGLYGFPGQIRIYPANETQRKSPGITLIPTMDFLYDGLYLGRWGFGFHLYDGYYSTYISGDSGVNLFTGQQIRLRIDENGNVGIGTTEPASKLVVTGTVNIADKPGTDVNSPSLIIGDIWDTSAAGGVFDIADNVWLTQQRHRMYVLNGIRTDGDIIVETGNLNVGGVIKDSIGGSRAISLKCSWVSPSITCTPPSCPSGTTELGTGCAAMGAAMRSDETSVRPVGYCERFCVAPSAISLKCSWVSPSITCTPPSCPSGTTELGTGCAAMGAAMRMDDTAPRSVGYCERWCKK